MNAGGWYSAKLRKICLVEGKGATMAMVTVCVFRASDFSDAFVRVVKLGRSTEEEYRNEAGRLVRWRLKEVVTLDVLPGEELDGVEVNADLADLRPEESVSFESEFRPEDSKPDQSL
jgi:hypothetical protein